MARAHFETYILDEEGRPIPGATVTVREPDDTTSISETIYAADEPDATTKANPFTADQDGRVVVYLANPKVVDLLVEKTGFDDRTVRATVHQLTASSLVLKDAGITMNQRAGVNFMDGFVLTDDAIDDETEVAMDWAGTAELEDIGAAEAAGGTGKVPDAGHVHKHPSGLGTDLHHAKSHAHDGADGSGTVAHSAVTGQTANDHHAKSHGHDGVDGSGTVVYSDLTGVPTEFAPDEHTHVGVGTGGAVSHDVLTGVSSDDHHAKAHIHDGVDGSGTVAYSALTGTPTEFAPAVHEPTKHTSVMAQVAKAVAQAIPNGISTMAQVILAGPALISDTGVTFTDAQDKLSIDTGYAGRWRFKLHAVMENPASSSYDMRAIIRLNGVNLTDTTQRSAVNGANGPSYDLEVRSDFAEGDEITFFVAHNEGTNQNLLGDGTLMGTYVEAEFLGV